MSDRGDYRGIYTVLTETPEFQDLPPEAQLVWFHLKLKLGASGIDVLDAAEAVISERSGIPSEGVADAIEILSTRGWLARDRNVLWLRNALRFEPSRNLKNDNHKKSILAHLQSLPKRKIVNDFAKYYKIELPFPDLMASGYHPDTKPITEDGVRKTEDGGEEPSSLRSEEPPPTTAAAVGVFLERTGSEWRLDRTIAEWVDEVEREPKYAGADIPYEIMRCADWHVSKRKKPPAPDLAIRNWLKKAADDERAKAAEARRGARNTVPTATNPIPADY